MSFQMIKKILSNIFRYKIHYSRKQPFAICGKTALVIGGTSGIGYQTARELICSGCKHVMIAGKTRDKCNIAVLRLKRSLGNNNVSCVCFDVTDAKVHEEALMYAVDKLNYIDIIVNCFGVLDGQNWEKEIYTNAISMIRGTLLGYDFLGTDSVGCGGVIINVAGVMGIEPMPGVPSLTAAKHAVVGFSRSYGNKATEAETNVKLITVCPGITITKMWSNLSEKVMLKRECELQKNLSLSCSQKAAVCGKSIVYLIKHANTGTVWIIESSRLYLMEFPSRRCLSHLKIDYCC